MTYNIPSEREIQYLKDRYLGKKVQVEILDPYHPIINTGTVERVDGIGQLHGTWGGLAAITGEDIIKILD